MEVPHGFENLVKLVENAYPKPGLVLDDAKMWSWFCWAVLLGRSFNQAEVNCIHYILRNDFKRENIKADWLTNAKKV